MSKKKNKKGKRLAKKEEKIFFEFKSASKVNTKKLYQKLIIPFMLQITSKENKITKIRNQK